ncbi:unnamed protein product [Schistosoma curassoni]|uniref:Swirm domain-containing protein n=1 Tax=Schistosoma curassoni TaxID=6186 RepID=A0A183K1H9_9TREM|nr:unnamed protein product [Schistosoma curassoni]
MNSIISFQSEDVRLLENEYQLGLDNLEKLAQLKDECYLLRMKANNEKATLIHSKNKNKQLKLTEKNQYILSNKSQAINNSTDTISSEIDSVCSEKQKQSKWNTTTTSIISTITNNPAEFVRYPTVLTNHSNIVKQKKSTVKKKSIEKMFNDTYYPNLQNLYKTSLDEKDFLLYETRQLLERQSQRFNKAITGKQHYTIPNWLSNHGLTAKKLRLTDLLKPFTVRLRPTYIPALRHHVVSEVLKQTLPIAYVNKKKSTKSPEIHLFNPLAINFEQYEKDLRNALFLIEKKLIEIIFEYIDNDSLNNLRKDVNLDKYTKWRSKLCWYQDYANILKTFEKNNWPFPQNEFNLLTNELDMGQKYLNEAKHLKNSGNSHRSYRTLKQMNSTFSDRAPCGHPYRIHH